MVSAREAAFAAVQAAASEAPERDEVATVVDLDAYRARRGQR